MSFLTSSTLRFSLSDAVVQQTAYYERLLASLAELEGVPDALAEQNRLVDGWKRELKQSQAKRNHLKSELPIKKMRYMDAKEPGPGRLVAAMLGKSAKHREYVRGVEQAYNDALHAANAEETKVESLTGMIKEGSVVRAELEHKLQRFEITRRNLDGLYSRLFDGPTPDYPEDDRLESAMQVVLGRYNHAKGQHEHELQAVNQLQSADRALAACLVQLTDGAKYAVREGGTADAMKRSALSAAQNHATQAATCIQQAIIVVPEVRLPSNILTQGPLLGEVNFDFSIYGTTLRNKIRSCISSVESTREAIVTQMNAAKTRASIIESDLTEEAELLEQTRKELTAYRRQVVQSILENPPPEDLPPDYRSAPSSPVHGPSLTSSDLPPLSSLVLSAP